MHQHTSPYLLGQQIVQLVASSAEPSMILSQMALKIGTTLSADMCLVIAGVESPSAVLSGSWWADEAVSLEPKAVSQLLTHPEVTDSLEQLEPTTTEISVRSYTQLGEILSVSICVQVVTYFEGTANGMIFLGYRQPYQKNLEEEWLPIVSESAAIAFSQLELRQQTEMNNRYQTLFREFNEICTSSDLNSRLKISLAAVSRALQVERSFVLKLKYKDPLRSRKYQEIPQGSVEVVSQWSVNELSAAFSFLFSLSESALCQKAWRCAPQILAIANRAELRESVELEASHVRVFPPEPVCALLAVPILGTQSGDSGTPVILGFFILQQQKSRRWQADEIELVKWAASQASTDIISNQALQRVQSLVNERTTQLKFSLDVQAKLSEKMRQQIEELRHVNEVKDKFIANLSDALKHPLTKMKVATEMLKVAPEGEPRQRYLGILEQECTKEINLVNDLLTLHYLESSHSQIQPQRFELPSLINELTATFRKEWAEKGLSLELDYGETSDHVLSLYSDPESLNRILLELLTNAGKFSAADTTVCLRAVRQRNRQQNQIVITVTNVGTGISPEEQEQIFDKFQRGKNAIDATNQGTGLGLALVKLLVEHLNGTIKVASHSREDSLFVNSFTVTLPQFQPQQVG